MNVEPIRDFNQGDDDELAVFLSVMRYICPFLPPYVESDPNTFTLLFQVAMSYDIKEIR